MFGELFSAMCDQARKDYKVKREQSWEHMKERDTDQNSGSHSLNSRISATLADAILLGVP
jgi:hypothetical protein